MWYRLPGLLISFLLWSPSPQYLSSVSGKAGESVTKGLLVIIVVPTGGGIRILYAQLGPRHTSLETPEGDTSFARLCMFPTLPGPCLGSFREQW